LKQFKKILGQLTNILFVVILGVLLVRFYNSYKKNSAFEGKSLPTTTLNRLSVTGKLSTFSTSDLKPPYIIIFWSTTCPPCLVELKRLNYEVNQKTISPDKIIAINTGERLKDVQRFMKSKEINFPLYQNPKNIWAKYLQLQATPLVVHINKAGTIEWMSTGVSPTGILRAKKLLKQ
jgi:thiol-disulfide isomerase/thioredoxin